MKSVRENAMSNFARNKTSKEIKLQAQPTPGASGLINSNSSGSHRARPLVPVSKEQLRNLN